MEQNWAESEMLSSDGSKNIWRMGECVKERIKLKKENGTCTEMGMVQGRIVCYGKYILLTSRYIASTEKQ